MSAVTDHGAPVGLAAGPSEAGLAASLRRQPWLTLWVIGLLIVMGVGLAAFAYQFANGLVVTGMRNTMMWGQYILFFMFFMTSW